jgi:tetratricopeptide (TPR) repeat protein
MGAMGDFFSNSENGPMILLIILVVDGLVVVGAWFLLSRTIARRVIRRATGIMRLAAAGETDAARSLAVEWDRALPRSPFARVNLAKVWSVVGDQDRALELLDATKIPARRACRPLRRIAAHVRYDALRALGQSEKAEWFLRDQSSEDPTAPWIVTSRLSAAKSDGDLDAADSALADVRTAFERQPKNENVLAALAQEALAGHRFAEAADLLERLLERLDRPGERRLTMMDAYLLLGMAQLAAGRDAAADQTFRHYAKRSSDPVIAEWKVATTRAGALMASLRLDEAATVYGKLTEGPEPALAFVGLAMCRIRQGEPEHAKQALDTAEETGYPSEKARFLRSQILVDLGEVSEAERLAREAANEHPPSDPETVYTLAYVAATGHLPDAEAILRRYVELVPNDPDLGPLLERRAPDGRTWRERLEVAPGQEI